MKITFYESPPAVDKTVLEQTFKDCEFVFCDKKLDKNNIDLAKDSEIVSVFINSLLNKEAIDSLPKLKFITTRSAGFDHIDLQYCAQKGILVSSVPCYGDHTVAELTFAFILNLSRNILKANNYIRETSDFNVLCSFCGFDLNGKTIGIIGAGRIGKNVIKIAKGFNMNVIAYDLHPDLEFAKINNFEYKSLEEIISQSDIISLHTPFTKENFHIINKETISRMKKGVLLINTARGALIDNSALIWGIQEGIIGGAGLDVLEGERDLKIKNEIFNSDDSKNIDYKMLAENQLLMEMSNVIITPHIGFYSKEAENEIFKVTVENIKGFLSNNLINLVK
ncbi:MAG: NAD(P)-dependent oxidoreductase [Candidatus Paceibacterota bacterium]|jgi:D-lactate dehydrogenase